MVHTRVACSEKLFANTKRTTVEDRYDTAPHPAVISRKGNQFFSRKRTFASVGFGHVAECLERLLPGVPLENPNAAGGKRLQWVYY